jgi:RpiB/LacA/LacB family sugar-phosphate isomerase
MAKKIYLGADHAGFELKEKIKKYFDKKKIGYQDLGNLVYDKNDDYPDVAALVAKTVIKNKSKGILICGSSHGVCTVVNKFKGVRASSAANELEAYFARKHGNNNVLCLAGGGTVDKKGKIGFNWPLTKKIIDKWLTTKFDQATRRKRRLNKIKKIEKQNFK